IQDEPAPDTIPSSGARRVILAKESCHAAVDGSSGINGAADRGDGEFGPGAVRLRAAGGGGRRGAACGADVCPAAQPGALADPAGERLPRNAARQTYAAVRVRRSSQPARPSTSGAVAPVPEVLGDAPGADLRQLPRGGDVHLRLVPEVLRRAVPA